MKSYLSLIPIAARVHRRQNWLTQLCIIFSVFLVTAVFSMAEMGVRMEQIRLHSKQNDLTLQDMLGSAMGQSLFVTAGVLFVLVLLAGVLMISSSINSSVAQCTQFFGMMRCIGMSRQQIVRFVRLEALNWCKTAVPIGIVLGMLATWGMCGALHFVVGEEFSDMPLFGVSGIGVVSGAVVGIAAVSLAAGAPARRAARVSPVAAVSGQPENAQISQHAACTGFLPVDIGLGIRHAMSAKKNLVLMTGSFALSIILFLSFSVLIDFVDCLMPQSTATADLELVSADGANNLDAQWIDKLAGMDGIKNVYGRRNATDMPARLTTTQQTDACTVDLVSFSDFDLTCLAQDGMLQRGSDLSGVYGNSQSVLATWDPSSPWSIGDRVQIGGETVEIGGLLRYDPFTADGMTEGKLTLIVSDQTFVRLTGVHDYTLILIQTARDATEQNIAAIRDLTDTTCRLVDRRDQRTTGTYLAFVCCIYSFLGMIALVALLNIVNSISMSVTARVKQYGIMRAVGMDGRQIGNMIVAEAFTYAVWGCVVGCAIGLPLSKYLYDGLITAHFAYATWHVPVASLGVIVAFVVFAALAAVCAPIRRIHSLSVTQTINEL